MTEEATDSIFDTIISTIVTIILVYVIYKVLSIAGQKLRVLKTRLWSKVKPA